MLSVSKIKYKICDSCLTWNPTFDLKWKLVLIECFFNHGPHHSREHVFSKEVCRIFDRDLNHFKSSFENQLQEPIIMIKGTLSKIKLHIINIWLDVSFVIHFQSSGNKDINIFKIYCDLTVVRQ